MNKEGKLKSRAQTEIFFLNRRDNDLKGEKFHNLQQQQKSSSATRKQLATTTLRRNKGLSGPGKLVGEAKEGQVGIEGKRKIIEEEKK